MKHFKLGACSILPITVLLCLLVEPADALLLRNQTNHEQVPSKLTGLLCREPGAVDMDVVLEEGGRRSLLFSKTVKDENDKIVGRKVAGLQSTVHCAIHLTAPHERECLPADLAKPIPTCSEVGKSGKCPCVAVVNEPLKLPYQQAMVSETLKLCQAKAQLKQPFRVLMFGLGGGAMPMYLRHRCESADIQTVENDLHVALIAQKLLGWRADDKNRLEIADGEEAATRRAKTNVWPEGPHFDMVLVDCFDGEDHVPASCRSTSFVTALHNLLLPGGQVLQNVMDVDEKVVMPMYHATFGDEATQRRVVRDGQILVVAKTPPDHPRSHPA